MNNAVASETGAQNVKVEELGPCRRKLLIEVPGDVVAGAIASKMENLVAEARLPGFRPGKAPRGMIEKRFGKAVRDEAKQQLAAQAYQDAVRTHELRVIGDPEGGEELVEAELEPGVALSFSLEVEVAPDFELPDISKLEIKKPTMEVDDDMVGREVDRLCTMEGELKETDSSGPGSYCIGHGVMKDDTDKVVLDIDGAVVQIPDKDGDGTGMILGVLVDDFAKQFGAPKKGDTAILKTTGPENHENVSIRSKPLTIEFEVTATHEIAPATAEKLAEKFGLENETQLRENIMLRLNQRMLIDQQQSMRQQVVAQLLQEIDFDLPEKLSAGQAARNLERRRLELMHRGEDPQRIEENLAELRAATDDVTQRELKLFFILQKVAAEHSVQVNEGEINARIAQMAMERGERPEKLRNELIQSGNINGIAQQIQEHKALDALVGKANVEELDADAFRKWAESQAD